ncbi:MAG: HEAT repeat domain-containing protein [Planctomycetota bacterium]
MAASLLLLLLAPDPVAVKVPEVIRQLEANDVAGALATLKEIESLKADDAEAKALVRMIRSPEVRKPSEVLEASFLALKGIGSRAVTKDLLALLKNSPLRKDPAVRIGVCRAFQGSADPAGIPELVDMLHDVDDRVIAASAEAASAHRHAKEEVRKELFEELLKIYVPTWNLKNSVDGGQKVAKARAERRWAVIEKPMERSLQLLSNVTQNDPPAWQRWWNKNKKKRWAAAEGA